MLQIVVHYLPAFFILDIFVVPTPFWTQLKALQQMCGKGGWYFETALRQRTYNQTVKVSACEGIDRYTYTQVYTKHTVYNLKSIANNKINRTSKAL